MSAALIADGVPVIMTPAAAFILLTLNGTLVSQVWILVKKTSQDIVHSQGSMHNPLVQIYFNSSSYESGYCKLGPSLRVMSVVISNDNPPRRWIRNTLQHVCTQALNTRQTCKFVIR